MAANSAEDSAITTSANSHSVATWLSPKNHEIIIAAKTNPDTRSAPRQSPRPARTLRCAKSAVPTAVAARMKRSGTIAARSVALSSAGGVRAGRVHG